MKYVAALLLLGVFFRHSAHNWLAEGSNFSSAAWFYMLGGVWEFVLCGLIAAILSEIGKPNVWTRLAIAAAFIGMSEGLQTSICRAVTTNISTVPKSANLCDHAAGLPIGAVMFALYFLIICTILGRHYRERSASKLC